MTSHADNYLGERLLELGHHAGPYQDAAFRFARHALVAFQETGLLSPAEAAAWSRRLGRAAEDPIDRPRSAPAIRAAAHRYLEELVAHWAVDAEKDFVAHARIDGAIRALAEIGAVSEREAMDWGERAFPAPADVAGLPRFEKTHMTRVTRASDERVDGLQLTLIERYTDGVTVNWHEQPARLGERAMGRIRKLVSREAADLIQASLSDDIGTLYTFCGGSASHGIGGRAAIGHTDFAPAPPTEARSLVFESLGRQIRITLDD